MIPPKVIKLRNLKKLLGKYHIVLKQGTKHQYFESPEGMKYPIPSMTDNDDVEKAYVNGARRRFGLTREDGVTDDEFYGK